MSDGFTETGLAGIDLANPAIDGGSVRDVPRRGLAGAAQRVMDGLNGLLAVVSALAIAVAGGVLTWEVIGRYFLSIPSDWQDELSIFLLIGATFGSAAWTQARRGHVGIDALAHVLPPRVDRVRRVAADFFSLVFVAFFALKSWQLFYEAWDEGQITPSSWGPPLWIPYSCMAAGMTLLALQLLLQLVGSRHQDAMPAHLA